MEETAQNFEKRFFINRSQIFIALPKYYVTHRIYEILSKSLVPNTTPLFKNVRTQYGRIRIWTVMKLDSGIHHEGNIRGGRNPVHVVSTDSTVRSRSLLLSPHPPSPTTTLFTTCTLEGYHVRTSPRIRQGCTV